MKITLFAMERLLSFELLQIFIKYLKMSMEVLGLIKCRLFKIFNVKKKILHALCIIVWLNL